MELLLATWTLRLAVVAGFAVAGVSYSAGSPAIDCLDRGMVVAFGFTLAGRWLVGFLEPPERRLLRMRLSREAGRRKQLKAAAGKGAAAATSTISRTA